jgi:tRNA-specific 2-thiouridylase
MSAYNENISGTPVIVALSGGVDSAVAAFLLKEAHYNVSGVIMRIWDSSLPAPATSRSACFGPDEEQDIQDAESICEKLGIDLHVVDCSSEFRNTILSSFSSDYRKGGHPIHVYFATGR